MEVGIFLRFDDNPFVSTKFIDLLWHSCVVV